MKIYYLKNIITDAIIGSTTSKNIHHAKAALELIVIEPWQPHIIYASEVSE